jgi:aerobic carbon-monoxide dehydrogenase medium subunit
VSARGRREIAAGDFFRTYLTTALEPDELLLSVRFPAAAPGTGAAFCEVSRGRGDFAIAGGAAQVTLSDDAITDARICLSGVADVPFRCHGPERVLLGTRADPATLVRAAEAALEILDPPGDLHAPAGYRKHVAGVLLRRAVAEAFGRAAAWGEGDREPVSRGVPERPVGAVGAPGAAGDARCDRG